MAEPQCAASDLFIKDVAPDSISQGNEYILIVDGKAIWRKVRSATNPDAWRLVSRNRSEYPDIYVNKSAVERAWRIVARMAVMSH
jgi:hypothetical protein